VRQLRPEQLAERVRIMAVWPPERLDLYERQLNKPGLDASTRDAGLRIVSEARKLRAKSNKERS